MVVENPYPLCLHRWMGAAIKNGGAKKHHDMMFGNFDDDAAIEFVYWNQNAKQLLMVDIPSDPLTSEVVAGYGDHVLMRRTTSARGLTQADVDGDGKIDIIGGSYWFKPPAAQTSQPISLRATCSRTCRCRPAHPWRPAGDRQVPVTPPGWGAGLNGTVEAGSATICRLVRIEDGHSLDIADVDGGGNLDIFVGEMRYADSRHPDARTLLLLGDGQGNFAVETVATGIGHHESRLADLDGDGDIDILGKPFTWDTPRRCLAQQGRRTGVRIAFEQLGDSHHR